MWDALQIPLVRTGIALAVLAVLIAAAIWLLKRLRGNTAHDQLTLGEAFGNFAEMRRRGDISEDEFRTIEALMGDRTRPKPDRSDQSE